LDTLLEIYVPDLESFISDVNTLKSRIVPQLQSRLYVPEQIEFLTDPQGVFV